MSVLDIMKLHTARATIPPIDISDSHLIIAATTTRLVTWLNNASVPRGSWNFAGTMVHKTFLRPRSLWRLLPHAFTHKGSKIVRSTTLPGVILGLALPISAKWSTSRTVLQLGSAWICITTNTSVLQLIFVCMGLHLNTRTIPFITLLSISIYQSIGVLLSCKFCAMQNCRSSALL